MGRNLVLVFTIACLTGLGLTGCATHPADAGWVDRFTVPRDELASIGKNPYFSLEPGYQLVLEDDDEQLTITVLHETVIVDGVETRIIEERETKGGQIIEISRNFHAISTRTNNVYYFGEDVDVYKNGQVASHPGVWRSGASDARFGMMMPGKPTLGQRHYQEIAPGVAMDRAKVVSLSDTLTTPAGTFSNCLRVEETTPLEPGVKEYKVYAPGVGLIKDGSLKLVRVGMVP